MKVLDLFSGIGGFSLGLERAGFETVAFCEINPFCRSVLAKHWPGVPCYEDVRTLTTDALSRDGISGVDVICGGFPCQDISSAGFMLGMEGERSILFEEIIRLSSELRPSYIIMENVSALLNLGMGDVLSGVASIGYDAEWHCIPASALGASHQRDRVWIIAYPPKGDAPAPLFERISSPEAFAARCIREVGSSSFCKHEGIASVGIGGQPALCGTDDGLSYSVVNSRLGALGNSVVPQIPELIGRAILEAAA